MLQLKHYYEEVFYAQLLRRNSLMLVIKISGLVFRAGFTVIASARCREMASDSNILFSFSRLYVDIQLYNRWCYDSFLMPAVGFKMLIRQRKCDVVG